MPLEPAAPRRSLSEINQELKLVKSVVFIERDIEKLRSYHVLLKRIPDCLNMWQRLQEIKPTILKFSSFDFDTSKFIAQRDHLFSLVETARHNEATYLANLKISEELEKEISLYESKPPEGTSSKSTDVLTENKHQIQISIDQYEELKQAAEINEHLDLQRVEVEKQRNLVMQYYTYEANLVRLYKIVEELQSQAMEQTVEAINTGTNAILAMMFDEEIKVYLRTHRELKTKDVMKLQVNLQVLYKGQIYDSPKLLSGGEKNRISMALTLAMARVSGSPILLLDECMTSLDNPLRERCIQALKEHLGHKTVVNICHEAVVGIHESSISLDTE